MAMRSIIITGFVLALASGLFLNYPGHPWQVVAQTTNAKNATQSSTAAAKNISNAAGSAANKTSAVLSGAAKNVTSTAQAQNKTSSNPLAKIPVIGKLFGGK
jgi:hypothetical protein